MAGTGHTSVRSYTFYIESTTPVAGTYAQGQFEFVDMVDGTPFTSQGIIITNDNTSGGDNIQFSFDGTTLHGTVKPTEIITFDFRRTTQIFLKSPGASSFRLWAW